ncbi:alpha/beta hydrolase [Variovorax paradoxus]|uniref:alpha/beta hydrolase n=1 Tax=Variovorax paradoxus TaxID=34073 RepID=UPI0035219B29
MRETRCPGISRKLRRFCAVSLGLLAAISCAQAAEDPTGQPATPSASVYRNIAGRDLRIFEFPPVVVSGNARPAVLFVQGGAWSRGSPEQLFRSARYFADKGFVSVVLEYRLADATNSPAESFSDVCHALAFLRKNADKFGLAPSRHRGSRSGEFPRVANSWRLRLRLAAVLQRVAPATAAPTQCCLSHP